MNKDYKSRIAIITFMKNITVKTEVTAVQHYNMFLHAHYSQPQLEV